jgi:hypothetical protein
VTVIKGADYAWSRPPAAALKAAGIKFAARYLSPDPSKNVTAAEVKTLLGAGISIVVVWESTAARILTGKGGGAADAATAIAQARAAGLTDPVVVYFACDYDATEADQPAINAYLDGAAQILGRDFTGIYGGFFPLSRARAAGKAAWFWGTYAWSGTNWDTCGWTPHIMQATGTTTIGGVDVDIDTAAAADYGQWPRPEGPPVSATGPEHWDITDWEAITYWLAKTLWGSQDWGSDTLKSRISAAHGALTAIDPAPTPLGHIAAAVAAVIPPAPQPPTADAIAVAVAGKLNLSPPDLQALKEALGEFFASAFPAST